jgi:hypothetical protein
MKHVPNSFEIDLEESKSHLLNRFRLFVLKPTFIGLFTFSLFFTTILLTKVATYIFADGAIFTLNIYDVLFALIGFGVGFIVEFLLQIRRILKNNNFCRIQFVVN